MPLSPSIGVAPCIWILGGVYFLGTLMRGATGRIKDGALLPGGGGGGGEVVFDTTVLGAGEPDRGMDRIDGGGAARGWDLIEAAGGDPICVLADPLGGDPM